MEIYRQRIWTNKYTLKNNHTFEECLVSERKIQETCERLPSKLISQFLNKIQYSNIQLILGTLEKDPLVNELMNIPFVEGEIVRMPSTNSLVKILRRDGTSCLVNLLDAQGSVMEGHEASVAVDFLHREVYRIKDFIHWAAINRDKSWTVRTELVNKYSVFVDSQKEKEILQQFEVSFLYFRVLQSLRHSAMFST